IPLVVLCNIWVWADSRCRIDPPRCVSAKNACIFYRTLTPGVSRAGKRERGTSGRCTASAAHPGSAQVLARTPGFPSYCSQRAAQTTDFAPDVAALGAGTEHCTLP